MTMLAFAYLTVSHDYQTRAVSADSSTPSSIGEPLSVVMYTHCCVYCACEGHKALVFYTSLTYALTHPFR
jgi:hypothetical protein